MKRIVVALLLMASSAQAQNVMCSTRPTGDNSNACASTAYVQGAIQAPIFTTLTGYVYANGASLATASTTIPVGSITNGATALLSAANTWDAVQTFSSTPIFNNHVTVEGVTSTGATGTGKFVFDNAPTITGHPTIEGVTSTGAQGTGALVFATSPTLATPNIGVATGTSLNLSSSNLVADSSGNVTAVGYVKAGAGFRVVNLASSGTAPTISSGFGTSPSIVANNGTAAFTVNVGTGGTASSGVIGMPAATTGWICSVNNITTTSTTVYMTKQTASTTTSVTVTNYNTSAAAAAWVASNVLNFQCTAY